MLARAFARVVDKAPALMKGKQGWWTPLNATNRVLTGPFKSTAEAQGFVHKLAGAGRSEEHTSELQSLMRISYAVFSLIIHLLPLFPSFLSLFLSSFYLSFSILPPLSLLLLLSSFLSFF